MRGKFHAEKYTILYLQLHLEENYYSLYELFGGI